MARRMSCSLTVQPVQNRIKVVTRRHVDTWKDLAPGDPLVLIEKGMGLPKGTKQTVLAEVVVVSNTIERVIDVTDLEIMREGFDAFWTPPIAWARWWARHHGYTRAAEHPDLELLSAVLCRRIEWRYT